MWGTALSRQPHSGGTETIIAQGTVIVQFKINTLFNLFLIKEVVSSFNKIR